MQSGPPSVNPYAPPVASVDGSDWAGGFAFDAQLAERSTRFVAQLADNFLYAIVVLPGFFGFFMTSGGESLVDEDSGAILLLYAWLLPLPMLLACYQWYLVSTTGQSLAKRWFGIKIVRMDGSEAGFVYGVLLRSWVLQALNAVCGLVGLIDALMIFGDQRRCLHDHLAGTKVIKA